VERYVVITGMLIHVIHYFDRGFARATVNESKLMLVEERVFVEKEG